MSTLGFGSLSPAAAAPAPEVEDTSGHWAPHGAVLTAFVVGINVLVIVLIFFFFCRFFSGKGGDSASDDADDGELPVASPWASRRRRRREAPAARALEDVASALPVYVYSSSADADGGGKKAPECAVCIVELRDGDSARRLPRCGHRFHADCVGAWLRLHATCPLCRATVMAPAAGGEARNAKDDVGVGGADCPV
ncbi:putative RING zinc finger domain superfamily protein [Panicum miliaceum]|uniref:RING-type E3 ubiquitin transferase n=1 Tax=Panicum miliaceum TaxID=4540 RepID=A0A3L6R6H2_PANMI|nr:putative RING zinc finger domain superfamily protein [Panicum miliaceum]